MEEGWSLTHPALIHRRLALLTALVQLVIAPLPVPILRLVQVATGAWDSPHLIMTTHSWETKYSFIHSSCL